MKMIRFSLLAAFVLAATILVSHRTTAQSTSSIKDKEPIDNYTQLVLSLSERGDSNTVKQVTDLLSDMNAQRSATEVAFNTRILNELRSGKTNAAIELLEIRLDGGLTAFDSPDELNYRQKYGKILKSAKEYRSKHPYKSGNPEIDVAVARTFDSLPK
jgi:hypothetical protein